MAARKKREAVESGSDKTMDLRVVVEATRDTPTYYVNHAQLTFSEHEVALVFARMPTKPSRDEIREAEEFGELTVDPELQIIIPPTVLPRLIDALEMIRGHYEENYGKIGRTDNAANG